MHVLVVLLVRIETAAAIGNASYRVQSQPTSTDTIDVYLNILIHWCVYVYMYICKYLYITKAANLVNLQAV